MEAVVGAVDDVRLIQNTGVIKLLHERFDHLVDCLKRPQPRSLVLIVVLDDGGVERIQVLDPADAALDLGIEAGISGDGVVLE